MLISVSGFELLDEVLQETSPAAEHFGAADAILSQSGFTDKFSISCKMISTVLKT
jgi:hypothetical protein